MVTKGSLLKRLDEIATSLQEREPALALIGLGSIGLELDRLDDYSDLDFFVIIEAGHKAAFLDDLSWLQAIHPIAYYFRNTADGYKLLFEDGIFCEFAVFEPAELEQIPFAPGRILWKRPQVAASLAHPAQPPPPPEAKPLDWLLGEALTNLYVGLSRFRRGEKLSAASFIQGYAVDRLLELAPFIEETGPAMADPFGLERRFEWRYSAVAKLLPRFIQGYDRTPQSALAILDFLENHFPVNQVLAWEIRRLADMPDRS